MTVDAKHSCVVFIQNLTEKESAHMVNELVDSHCYCLFLSVVAHLYSLSSKPENTRHNF